MSKQNKKVLPRSKITVSAAVPDQTDQQIEYIKESVTNFSIPLSDVHEPRGPGTSYDLLWVVPGYGTTSGAPGNQQSDMLIDGVLCDLQRSTYKVENLSPYTLFLRLQRPMGYKTAPSALGMWEPATHGKDSLIIPIRPHTMKTFKFSNTSTGLMQPRMEMRQGKTCVHLATMALTKELISDYGTIITDAQAGSQDAVAVTVVTQYKANDGNVGNVGEYCIVSYAGTQRMNEINTGPPPGVRVVDLRLQGGNAELALIQRGINNEFVMAFVNGKGEQRYDCDGLDKSTIYELPFGIPAKGKLNVSIRNVRYIRWNETDPAYQKNNWVLSDVSWGPSQTNPKAAYNLRYEYVLGDEKTWPGRSSDGLMLTGNSVLKPAVAVQYAFKNVLRNTNNKIKTRVSATVHSARCYQQLSDFEDGILDVFLTACVIIIKVVKVGIEIAGMVGVLAISPPVHSRLLVVNGIEA